MKMLEIKVVPKRPPSATVYWRPLQTAMPAVYVVGEYINYNYTYKPSKVGKIVAIDRTAGYPIYRVDCGGPKVETVFQQNINHSEGELSVAYKFVYNSMSIFTLRLQSNNNITPALIALSEALYKYKQSVQSTTIV
jgi:hypothetical protein